MEEPNTDANMVSIVDITDAIEEYAESTAMDSTDHSSSDSEVVPNSETEGETSRPPVPMPHPPPPVPDHQPKRTRRSSATARSSTSRISKMLPPSSRWNESTIWVGSISLVQRLDTGVLGLKHMKASASLNLNQLFV